MFSPLAWIRRYLSALFGKQQRRPYLRLKRPLLSLELLEGRITPAAPVATDFGPAAVLHGQAISLDVPAQVSDADNDPLNISIVQQPSHGSLARDYYTGKYYYNADYNYIGSDSFTFQANDGTLDSNVATVSINVTDQAPVVTDIGPVSVLHGHSTSFDLAANASDLDSETPTVSIVLQPNHGSVYRDYYTGIYIYNADFNYTGSDSFTFKANDGALDSEEATVSINVTDQAPVVTDIGPVSVLHGHSTSFDLAANASDPDSETPTVSVVQQPSHGSVYRDYYTGEYIYNADFNYTGPDSFTFKANDGALDSEDATVSINVTDQAPTANNLGFSIFHGQTVSLDLAANVSDPDGETPTISIVEQPSHGSLYRDYYTGLYVYTAYNNYVGTDFFTFQADDGALSSNLATVSFTMTNGTFTWNGQGSGNSASDGANWTHGVSPIYGDLVIFDGTSSKTADIDYAFADTLTTVHIDAGFTGEISLQRDLTIATYLSQAGGLVTLYSGSLNIAAPASYEMSAGDLHGPNSLNIAGVMTWTGGAWDPGTANVANTGTWNIRPDSSVSITGWTVNNAGTTNWTQGGINSDASTFNNSGTFNISASAAWHELDASNRSTINNTGTLVSTGGDSEASVSIEAELNSSGAVNILAGAMSLKGGGNFSGSVAVSDNSSLELTAGSYTANDGATFTSAQQGQGPRGWMTIRSPFNVNGTVTDELDIRMIEGGGIPGGSITGTGTLAVNGTFTWSGGEMTGTGTTRVNGTMTVDFADTANNTLLLARNLQNYGTVNLVGNQADVVMRVNSGGSLINDGQFVFNTTLAGGLVSLLTDDRPANGGPVVNNSQFIVRGGGRAELVTDFGQGQPTNDNTVNGATGSIKVEAGSLWIGGLLMNYGYLEAAAGAKVLFGPGTFTFDPNSNDSSGDMMRGAGSFEIAGGDVVIPQFCNVHASNFYMPRGRLRGEGDFSAQYFAWSGGEMSEQGTTTVQAGARMDISDTVQLNGRTIRDFGLITWQYAEVSQTIEMSNSAEIQVDGGRFETFNVNGGINNVDESANKIVLTNGGTFVRNTTEVSGVITIEAQFENNGGSAEFSGNTRFYGYTQTLAASLSVFGAFSFDFVSDSSLRINGGTFRLTGGVITNERQLAVNAFVDANIEGYGTIYDFRANNCTINLTGVMNAGRFDIENFTRAYLHGFDLLISLGWSKTTGSQIFGQGGVARYGNQLLPLND